MKRIKHLLSLFFLSISTLIFAQWEQMITPSSYHLYAIEAVTDDIVYAGGYGGSLVKTTDGGANWVDLGIGMGHWVNAIHFFDEQHGWVTCQSGSSDTSHILKTVDGGLSWTSMHSMDEYSCMFWLDENTVYVGAWSGKIYKSSDAGNNWTEIITPGTSNLVDIQFFDALNGVAMNTDYEFMVTNDGGASWTTHYHGGIREFYFLTQNIGYCVDGYGRIGKTTDGGQTFTYYQTPFNGYKLQDIYFVNEFWGFAVGGLDCSGQGCVPRPVILSTHDGGNTWVNHLGHPAMGASIGFYEISVSPSGIPYLAGSNSVVFKNEIYLSSTPESQPQINLYPNPSAGLFQMSLPSENVLVEIYNTIGERVYRFETGQSQNLTVDLSGVAAGLYHVIIKNEKRELIGSKKIIINS